MLKLIYLNRKSKLNYKKLINKTILKINLTLLMTMRETL